MNWGQVQQRVLANLGKLNPADGSCIAQLPQWAEEFQRKVQRDRNYWFLKTTAERTIDQTVQTYAVPPDFKEGLLLYLRDDVNDQWVELFPLSNIDKVRLFNPAALPGDKAPPLYYEQLADAWTFWPWPDKQYVLRAEFWGDLTLPVATPLNQFGNFTVNDVQTNYWMDKFADLYISELTKTGFEYLQEFNAAGYFSNKVEDKSKGTGLLPDLRAQNVSRVLGSDQPLKPRTDVYGTNYDSRAVGWQVYYW